ncbi:MAG: TIM barrel protein, partial [Victivallales bacterium]|nr:TIM barrel protein [Victivallales bacterium]
MKIGCSTLLYHKRGLFKCMDDIARIGYEYVELNCVRGYYGHFNSIQLADSPELLEMIANSLKKNNLKCSGVDCHGLYQGPRFDMRYTEEYTEATMKVAKAVGAPMVITSYPHGDATWEERVNGTRRLAQMARAEGLDFAVEAEGGFAISNSTTMRK